MISHLYRVVQMPLTSIFGVAIGVFAVLFAPVIVAPITRMYDDAFPVINPVSSVIVGTEDDSVLVEIVARKNRGQECRILRIYADTFDAHGIRGTATVRRPNGEQHSGISHDAGQRYLGVWRIRPVDKDATRVVVFVEHDCVGRVARSTLADFNIATMP